MSRIGIPEELMKRMLAGDARCEFPIGTYVEKIAEDEGGDITPLGAVGKVIGNLYHEEPGVVEGYYIQWERAPYPTFAVKSKLKKHEQ